MSHLLTLGILQQVQNAGGGGDDGVLYDGEMLVGEDSSGREKGWLAYDNPSNSSISPSENGWDYCYVSYDHMDDAYHFYSNYPDIGAVLAHYKFGGTVYTSAESLFTYLNGEVGNTISLKVYEDAQ